MDFNLNFQLILLAVLLVLSAFFAISETSLMSVNKYRLKYLSKQGNVGAKLAIKLLNETDKLLSVILLCNNFANAAAAALVTLIVVEFFEWSNLLELNELSFQHSRFLDMKLQNQ